MISYFVLLFNYIFLFFFQAEDGIRDLYMTGVQTCALPICTDTEGPRNSCGTRRFPRRNRQRCGADIGTRGDASRTVESRIEWRGHRVTASFARRGIWCARFLHRSSGWQCDLRSAANDADRSGHDTRYWSKSGDAPGFCFRRRGRCERSCAARRRQGKGCALHLWWCEMIALHRVDDRLIHGQVVVGWGQPLDIEFIVLVDEAV